MDLELFSKDIHCKTRGQVDVCGGKGTWGMAQATPEPMELYIIKQN